MPPLQAFIKQTDAEGAPVSAAGNKEEAEYMLVCAEYELRTPNSIELLREYLDYVYPTLPTPTVICALIASAYFFEGKYDDALAMFNSSRLDLLSNEERDDMTYRLATCYLKTGNVKEAAIWFETLRSTGSRYTADCTYYLAYIRYSQQRYDDALNGFLSLQENAKYEALVPYYIAEIYLIKKIMTKRKLLRKTISRLTPTEIYGRDVPHTRYSRLSFRRVP